MRDLEWWVDHLFCYAATGVAAGFIIGTAIILKSPEKTRDQLYVDCIYNMRNRNMGELETMCAHLRTR